MVDVIQARVPLDHRDELELVAPREVGRAVGERVGPFLVGHLQRFGHAVPGLGVPTSIAPGRQDCGGAPQLLLHLMGPRLVAAGDEQRLALGDSLQRRNGVGHAAQARRIARRTDEQEVVVHHEAAAHEVARVDQRALRVRRVRQHHVRVTAPAHGQRLPAAHGDHLDGVVGLPLEHGEQAVEQAGVAGGGRRGEDDHARLSEESRESHHRACICTMTRLLSMLGPCSLKVVYSSCSFRSSPERKYCTPPV